MKVQKKGKVQEEKEMRTRQREGESEKTGQKVTYTGQEINGNTNKKRG